MGIEKMLRMYLLATANFLKQKNPAKSKINDSFLIEMAKNKRAYAVIDDLNIIQTLSKSNYSNSNVILKFIAIGISADGTSYEKQYHDYWNPIMAEHQKKADAME